MLPALPWEAGAGLRPWDGSSTSGTNRSGKQASRPGGSEPQPSARKWLWPRPCGAVPPQAALGEGLGSPRAPASAGVCAVPFPASSSLPVLTLTFLMRLAGSLEKKEKKNNNEFVNTKFRNTCSEMTSLCVMSMLWMSYCESPMGTPKFTAKGNLERDLPSEHGFQCETGPSNQLCVSGPVT